jgi:Skp family chaperone for outer membrane proteins
MPRSLIARAVVSIVAPIIAPITAPIFAPALAAQAPAPKPTVYVSSQRLFAAAPGWDAAEAQYTHIVDSVHTIDQKMEDSLATLLTAYGRDEAAMTAVQRKTRRESIEAQHKAFDKRRDDLDAEVAARRAAILDPISDRVKTLLARVRDEKGYGMILDLDAGTILAADSTLDVTDVVIAEMKTLATR